MTAEATHGEILRSIERGEIRPWPKIGSRITTGSGARMNVSTARIARALGRFYRHNAMHAGTTPMVLDDFGRCARCVKLGFWKPDA